VSDVWPRVTVYGPARYTVRVRGALSAAWSATLGGMRIEPADQGEVTTLVGSLPDQAALMGVLKTLVAMGCVILSVECVGAADVPS
jgi:hypothetical protein